MLITDFFTLKCLVDYDEIERTPNELYEIQTLLYGRKLHNSIDDHENFWERWPYLFSRDGRIHATNDETKCSKMYEYMEFIQLVKKEINYIKQQGIFYDIKTEEIYTKIEINGDGMKVTVRCTDGNMKTVSLCDIEPYEF